MSLKYTFNGTIQWQRAECTPDEQFHLYEHDAAIGQPFAKSCADDQFCEGTRSASPAKLLAYSIATSHMFAFIELCGERAYSLKAYTDDPVVYISQGEEWVLDKVILTPKTFFEGSNIPEVPMLRELHDAASQKGLLEKLMDTKIEVRPM